MDTVRGTCSSRRRTGARARRGLAALVLAGTAVAAGSGTAAAGPEAAGSAGSAASSGSAGRPAAAAQVVGTVGQEPGLPNHTIYRPANFESLQHKIPIVAWGNGVCLANGTMYRAFLEPLSQYGVLIIASGKPEGQGGTTAQQLTEAIDWAVAENERPDSPYYGRLDTDMIAVMGQSCGGLQALEVSGDPRIKTTALWNSGLFGTGDKPQLRQLHAPTAWFTGGQSDGAYPNSVDDFSKVPATVPAVLGHYDNVGHIDLFFNPAHTGEAVRAALFWLHYAFTGDEGSKRMFVGPDCGLCSGTAWTLESKNFD